MGRIDRRGELKAAITASAPSRSKPAEPADDAFELGIIQKAEDKRYTFGVLYQATNKASDPVLDTHDEFAFADDLQKAQWDYVRKGNRNVYLQHGGASNVIGEIVDIVSWPSEVKAEFTHKGKVTKRTIPANSVWMGVIWTKEAWPAVKDGEIGGLSFGGWAKRISKRSEGREAAMDILNKDQLAELTAAMQGMPAEKLQALSESLAKAEQFGGDSNVPLTGVEPILDRGVATDMLFDAIEEGLAAFPAWFKKLVDESIKVSRFGTENKPPTTAVVKRGKRRGMSKQRRFLLDLMRDERFGGGFDPEAPAAPTTPVKKATPRQHFAGKFLDSVGK